MTRWWRDGGASPGGPIRVGFVVVATIDAALLLTLGAEEGSRLAPLALAAAIAFGHVVLVGFMVAGLADLGWRLVPDRWWARGAAAWAAASAAAFLVLAEDYAVFVPAVRIPLTLATALPFAVVAAVAARVPSRRAVGAACLAAGVALAAANPFVLDGGYHGLHLVGTLAAGVLAGLGLGGLAPHLTAGRPRAWVVTWAVLALVGAGSIVVRPSSDVVVALAQHPTASVHALSARLRSSRTPGGVAAIPEEQAEWFASRATRRPIPPTSPALHPSPIVILLTVDALRADLVADPKLPATRNLRALAQESAWFTEARSPASGTSASISALFTGKYYSSLHWTPKDVGRGKIKYFIPEEPTPRWPSLLAERGVRRVMVRRKGGFDDSSGLVDGMDEYTPMVSWADEIVDHVVAQLDRAGPAPLFIYSHVMDAHAPYDSRGKAKSPKEAYRREVAFIDEHLARLRTAIREKKLDDRTYLIVTADHGEAFGEHRTKYHAATIYEELVRIPLIVSGPGVVSRTIDEPVTLVDVGPTVLDLFGVATPGSSMGQSLVPLLRGGDVRLTRPIVLDTGRRKQAIVGRDGLKIIRNVKDGTVELYDLRKDPKELVNLVDTQPALAQERLGLLDAFFDVHERRVPGYEIPARD